MAAGSTLPQEGTVFVSLNDNDKNDRAANIVKNFVRLGFNIIATRGHLEVPEGAWRSGTDRS